MAVNELYQFSILSALMDGVGEHGVTASAITAAGDHGLGTFAFMDGEMVVIDGIAYQMKADGAILKVDATAISPFAMVTRFEPTIVRQMSEISKETLFDQLSEMLPETQNLFLGIRLDGHFEFVTVRTVGRQAFPGQSLSEVSKTQVVQTYEDIKGSLIGFRSPPYSQGISVAGNHIHFISKDRRRGGHMLAFQAVEATVSVSVIKKIHIELPETPEFNKAQLERDDSAVQKVEG